MPDIGGKSLEKSLIIPFKNGQFNCRIFGKGPEYIIALHGFGQDGNVFKKYLLPNQIIAAIDLPFHGASYLSNDKKPLSDDDLVEVVNRIRTSLSIQDFSLFAFSLGTRMAYPVIRKFAGNLRKVILVAPVGLYVNIWYWLATSTAFMRSIFKYLMMNQEKFRFFIALFYRFGLLGSSLRDFVLISAANNERGRQIYGSWCSLRHFSISPGVLVKQLSKHCKSLTLVVGSYDQVVKKESIKKAVGQSTLINIVEYPVAHGKLLGKSWDLLR